MANGGRDGLAERRGRLLRQLANVDGLRRGSSGQGGRRRTADGANAIIALRRALESDRFDGFRERRADAS